MLKKYQIKTEKCWLSKSYPRKCWAVTLFYVVEAKIFFSYDYHIICIFSTLSNWHTIENFVTSVFEVKVVLSHLSGYIYFLSSSYFLYFLYSKFYIIIYYHIFLFFLYFLYDHFLVNFHCFVSVIMDYSFNWIIFM